MQSLVVIGSNAAAHSVQLPVLLHALDVALTLFCHSQCSQVCFQSCLPILFARFVFGFPLASQSCFASPVAD